MAEQATLEDMKPHVAPANANKRKRQSLDEGAMRPAPATPYSRPQSSGNTGANEYNVNNDHSGAAFLAHAASGAGEEDIQHGAAGALDFGQLAQHGTTDPNLQPNGGTNTTAATDTAAAALQYPVHQIQVPQSTEMTFQNQASPPSGEGDRQMMADPNSRRQTLEQMDFEHLKAAMGGVSQNAASPPATSANATPSSKPPVGSDEWHKIRKDNHKEVERRRRETINEGINELAKIVPNCEKNKGSILQSAVRFITELKANETKNIEKWTLEKLLTEQAISELSASCEKFKAECKRAWAQLEMYKKACEDAGIVLEPLNNNHDEVEEQNGES
jgi:bHLH factor